MIFRSLTIVILPAFIVPMMAIAQANDQFIVNQFIGVDDPPTIPGNVIATPQSQSAIAVTWSAATDDIAVSGYEVYRDAMFLATVTAPTTSYGDTGLAASTTYSYEVRAFDSSNFYSGFSTSSATTTFQAVATTTPTTTPQSSGGSAPAISVLSFQIGATPSNDSIALAVDGSESIRVTISWSDTRGAILGTLSVPTLSTSHETAITGLRSGTTYRVTVTVTDEGGRAATRTITVTTTKGTDTTGPTNPSNFTATALPLGIRLSWNNPTDQDFENVRIMRQTGTIPVDPYDGTPIYEGSLTGYFDSDVMNGAVYGYTIFAKDESGNYSSGVVALIRAWSDETVGDVTIDLEGPEGTLTDDMTIAQREVIHAIQNGSFTITNDDPFLVSVPADHFPKVLKTILVTLTHPTETDKRFTFLLRANAEKTAYEARIDSLANIGRYGATIAFLDVSAQVVSKNDFAIEVTEGVEGSHPIASRPEVTTYAPIIFLGLLTLIALIAVRRMWLLGSRVRQEEPQEGRENET